MRRILSALPFACAVAASYLAAPAHAQIIQTTTTIEWVEDDGGADRFVAATPGVERVAQAAIAAYGPFRVIDAQRAALVDSTDSASPRHFAAMLAAYPAIGVIEMIDCPGTSDDTANLRLGRMIRKHGIATHVPADGSVRSGAVELFLAGARRIADDGAEFAVHSWLDSDGRQPADYPANDPVNLTYLNYYREMGLTDVQARAFYAMTNAVPFESARWLGRGEFATYAPLN